MSDYSIEPHRAAGHQVFEPVPTHADMDALRRTVNDARAGRARLAVAAVFLLGVVIAGLVGLFMLNGAHAAELTGLEGQIEGLEETIEARDKTITGLETQLADARRVIGSFADFQTIKTLQDQAAALEAEIAELAAQPSRRNAPASLTALPDPVEWRDDVVSALVKRRDELQAIKQRVLAWPPAVANPRPD